MVIIWWRSMSDRKDTAIYRLLLWTFIKYGGICFFKLHLPEVLNTCPLKRHDLLVGWLVSSMIWMKNKIDDVNRDISIVFEVSFTIIAGTSWLLFMTVCPEHPQNTQSTKLGGHLHHTVDKHRFPKCYINIRYNISNIY